MCTHVPNYNTPINLITNMYTCNSGNSVFVYKHLLKINIDSASESVLIVNFVSFMLINFISFMLKKKDISYPKYSN